MTTQESGPPVELLKRLPKFLELLPSPWPGNLESYFGSLRGESWERWWTAMQPVFVDAAVPRIPVQVISSEEDFRLRDPEAEAAGEQITVVINLWYSERQIKDAIDALLEKSGAALPAAGAHKEWLCEDFVIRAYNQPAALDKIYAVLKYTADGLTNVDIAEKLNVDDRDVRRMRQKGKHLLAMLAKHVFPVVPETN